MKLPQIPDALRRVTQLLEEFSAPCVAFSLQPLKARASGQSRLGGAPDLPAQFDWPVNKGRPLDFLLQINLSDTASLDEMGSLPARGLLSFFYDLEEQPWGYDPNDLAGFRVIYTPPDVPLGVRAIPNREFALRELGIVFRAALSLPYYSRAYDRLTKCAQFTDEEQDAYSEFVSELARTGDPNFQGGHHRLLGHSENVQGDMQLEAQLVTNGLYCGNPSGYKDPRAKALEAGADDWVLLLQLDSDESDNFMWGDCGMLYFWIRSQDLAERRFDRVWMTLQCC